MKILPLNAFSDNYIWLLYDKNKSTIVIDPGDSRPVLNILDKLNLNLEYILITHNHSDHIDGVNNLLEKTKAKVYYPDEINFTEIKLLNFNWKVLKTPGHTKNHISWYCQDLNSLFCGDTLFSAGCGRVFEGTMKEMYESLQKLSKLPLNTKIYPAHEYTLNNLKFSLTVEVLNKYLNRYYVYCKERRNQNLPTLPTNLKLELEINPFLRCNRIELIKSIKLRYSKIDYNDPIKVFTFLREFKNHF